jgi:hypothetical protein
MMYKNESRGGKEGVKKAPKGGATRLSVVSFGCVNKRKDKKTDPVGRGREKRRLVSRKGVILIGFVVALPALAVFVEFFAAELTFVVFLRSGLGAHAGLLWWIFSHHK